MILEDRPWTDLARLMRVSDKSARDHSVEAIAALAAWSAGRTVPPEPIILYRRNGAGAS